MFKKKASLPARPSIPTKEEILDDIRRATSEDVVFTLETDKSVNVHDLASANEFLKKMAEPDVEKKTNLQSHHQAYVKVASFVEKVNHLKECVNELKAEKDNLTNMEDSLISEISKLKEEIRNQCQTVEET